MSADVNSAILRAPLLACLVVGVPACSMIVGAEFDVHRRDAGSGAGERPAGDGATADTGLADAGGDAASNDGPVTPTCAPTNRFGAPIRLPLDTPDVVAAWGPGGPWGARLTADQLTVYFTARRGIWRAARATVADDFQMASATAVLTPTDPTLEDWAPTISGDGSTLFFGSGSQVNSPPNWQIFGATVDGQSLGPPAEVPSLAVADLTVQQSMPYLLPDGKVIYFSSTRTGSWDIFRADRATSGGDFGPPAAVTSINTAAQEAVAVVSPDELAIYFSSNRDDSAGWAHTYVATRTSSADGFGAALRLVELDVADDHSYPDWISADGCVIYFHHSYPNAVFVATRAP
jgi:hypothetical protein